MRWKNEINLKINVVYDLSPFNSHLPIHSFKWYSNILFTLYASPKQFQNIFLAISEISLCQFHTIAQLYPKRIGNLVYQTYLNISVIILREFCTHKRMEISEVE